LSYPLTSVSYDIYPLISVFLIEPYPLISVFLIRPYPRALSCGFRIFRDITIILDRNKRIPMSFIFRIPNERIPMSFIFRIPSERIPMSFIFRIPNARIPMSLINRTWRCLKTWKTFLKIWRTCTS